MLKINTTKNDTTQNTIKEQEKIRELDQFIISILLNENKKIDKKKAKKIYNDLNKFVCNNN